MSYKILESESERALLQSVFTQEICLGVVRNQLEREMARTQVQENLVL